METSRIIYERIFRMLWYYLNCVLASLMVLPEVRRLLPQTSAVKAARHGPNVKLAT
jgi:hypothetical protein